MSIFKKKERKPQTMPQYVEYDVIELQKKADAGESMTPAEYDFLRRARTHEITNRVLRIAGVCVVLFLVVLAVGCFLYPYSVFNLFGSGDRFWDCWQHVQYHLPYSDCALFGYSTSVGDANYVSASEWNDTFGWQPISEMVTRAFQGGSSAKLNFLTLGAWSIVLISTIGLIAVVVGSIYLVAYYIRDLIVVLKHFGKSTEQAISGAVNVTTESVIEGSVTPESGLKKTKVSASARKPKKQSKTDEAVQEKPEAPVAQTASEEDAYLEKLKKEISEEDASRTKEPDVTPVTPASEPTKPAASEGFVREQPVVTAKKTTKDLSNEELDDLLKNRK